MLDHELGLRRQTPQRRPACPLDCHVGFSLREGPWEHSLHRSRPPYTDTYSQVLQLLGITVLDDPRAFLQVDDYTVVLSLSPDIPVRQIITDIARPVILLWNKVTVGEQEDSFALVDIPSPRCRGSRTLVPSMHPHAL